MLAEAAKPKMYQRLQDAYISAGSRPRGAATMTKRNGNGSYVTSGPVYGPRTAQMTGRYGSRALGTFKEQKFHDVDIVDTIVSSAGSVQTSLNLIAQGITDKLRIGRVAFITRLYMREHFQITESVLQGNGSDNVRTMVILDKQCNKAIPAVSDILSGTGTIPLLDFNNLTNKNRFRVLYDKTKHISVSAAGGNGTAIETMRKSVTSQWFKKFKKPIPIEFTDATGDQNTITSNNLIVLSIAGQGIVKWDGHFRLRFTD